MYLEQVERKKNESAEVFAAHINPKLSNKLVNLVGRECVVVCTVGGAKVEALWDTGAQVI